MTICVPTHDFRSYSESCDFHSENKESETSWVSIRGAVFCRADASISSSPNLSRCPANARRKRLIHSLLQMSAYSPAAIATPKIRFRIRSTGLREEESDRPLH